MQINHSLSAGLSEFETTAQNQSSLINSMALTSIVVTELANTMKYGGGSLI